MTFYALRVNGYKEEDRMTTKGTKATEVKSEEDGAVLGEYFADLFADNRPIIELKTCKALANEQTAQVLGYLCSSGRTARTSYPFGSPRIQFKKKPFCELCAFCGYISRFDYQRHRAGHASP